jgi:hypothetical protein
MNIQLLQWGLFSFMMGIVLSLPLAAVHYQKNSSTKKVFTNARKLKAAHVDFFTQAFAAGFVYLIEYALKTEFPVYVIIPLVYGTIMNPAILLLEATPIISSGWGRIVYIILRATSPISLLFSWFAIAFQFLPLFLKILLLAVIIIGVYVLGSKYLKAKKQHVDTPSVMKA